MDNVLTLFEQTLISCVKYANTSPQPVRLTPRLVRWMGDIAASGFPYPNQAQPGDRLGPKALHAFYADPKAWQALPPAPWAKPILDWLGTLRQLSPTVRVRIVTSVHKPLAVQAVAGKLLWIEEHLDLLSPIFKGGDPAVDFVYLGESKASVIEGDPSQYMIIDDDIDHCASVVKLGGTGFLIPNLSNSEGWEIDEDDDAGLALRPLDMVRFIVPQLIDTTLDFIQR